MTTGPAMAQRGRQRAPVRPPPIPHWLLRAARALLLAGVCAGLFLIDLPYEARYFGVTVDASLVHLHTGFLLAVAMLTRDPWALRACIAANLGMWLAKVAWLDQLTPALVVYGVLAMAATWGLLLATRWALGWPRTGRRRQLRLADVPRFALLGTLVLPLALALLTAVLEILLGPGDRGFEGIANAVTQVFFAKHFGIVILTVPLVIAVTHSRKARAREPWWQQALPWRLLLVGVALPVLALALGGQLQSPPPAWLAGLLDYRLILAAVLILTVLYIDVRWSMPVLVLGLLLFTAGLTDAATASSRLPDLVALLRVAVETMILEALVVLQLLFNRDRDAALARRERDSRTDPFSGLANLAALRGRGVAGTGEVAFLLLDHSDKVSAALGLKAEAALMRAVAAHLRGYAECFHLGSGQLALVMSGSDTAAPWLTPWDAVLERMHAFELHWGTDRIRVLPYLGVAMAGTDGEGVDDLVLRAANAAFDARQRGETRAQAAEPRDRIGPRSQRRASLARSSAVLSQLRSDQIELYFQPVVRLQPDLDDGKVSGEVLCRLRDSDGSLMAPARFLPDLHAHRRMVELDLAVLRSLSRWLREHAGQLQAVGRLGINIAGQSLASTGFARSLFQILEDFPLPMSSLCLELTESEAISHTRRTARLFEGLRVLGCHVAIDDFGVGFQSFERLKQIPVDVIKIDGTFIEAMLRSAQDRELVRASVSVARAFNAETVAEYVGDAATAHALQRLGVDWGQGHHFGLPMPIGQALLVPVPRPAPLAPALRA